VALIFSRSRRLVNEKATAAADFSLHQDADRAITTTFLERST